jgi:hypothetical protein
MNITVCSAFRNAQAYVARYFEQIAALDRLLTQRGDTLALVLGHGDSTDDTDTLLLHYGLIDVPVLLIDCTHGGPVYGPVVDTQRFKQLAFVANRVLSAVDDDADAVVWIESDLIWEPGIVAELLNHLRWVAVAAPMVLDAPPAETWYDTFAFIRNGVNFTKAPPYHADLGSGLLRMDSVGSFVAIQADVARRLIVPDADVIVGACAQVRRMGNSIVLDSSLKAYHG